MQPVIKRFYSKHLSAQLRTILWHKYLWKNPQYVQIQSKKTQNLYFWSYFTFKTYVSSEAHIIIYHKFRKIILDNFKSFLKNFITFKVWGIFLKTWKGNGVWGDVMGMVQQHCGYFSTIFLNTESHLSRAWGDRVECLSPVYFWKLNSVLEWENLS